MLNSSKMHWPLPINCVGFLAGTMDFLSSLKVVRPYMHMSPTTVPTPVIFLTSSMHGTSHEVA